MKRLLIIIYFLTTAVALNAQILNDSVRNIYGPHTTLFVLEENIKYNIQVLQTLDTTLTGFHYFTPVDRLQRRYQDLGNPGTPMHPVYYQVPEVIGRTSGFHSFDPYFVSPEKMRYYDTKSPFSKLYFIIGGRGRSVVDVEYSRNVNENWNVGAGLQLISADKQIGSARRRGDRNSEATTYFFYTRYLTKNNRYQLLANFSRLGSSIDESGGVVPGLGNMNQMFNDPSIWLFNAESRDVRYNLHLYHQYKVSDLVQLYHSGDRLNQNVSFRLPQISETDLLFFQNFGLVNNPAARESRFFVSPDSTHDRSNFVFYNNELGVKGDIGPLFYNFYYKRRDLAYNNINLNSVSTAENYAGFNLRNNFTEDIKWNAFGEYLLGRNYRIGSGISFKFFEANVKRVRYEPSYLHELYAGNHLQWENDFSPSLSDNLYVAAHLQLPFLRLSPHVNFNRVNNHIYFYRPLREDSEQNRQFHSIEPRQASGAARIFSPGVNLDLRFFKNLYLENQFTYTGISGSAAEVFRIPRLFLNSKIYYGNSLFKQKLQLQVGLDMHFRSAYHAYGYEPVIQQFYVQDNFEIPAYPLADVFLNLKISRARIFVKYTNLSQAIGLIDGYFTTPYYIGQFPVLDFGISWLFFD